METTRGCPEPIQDTCSEGDHQDRWGDDELMHVQGYVYHKHEIESGDTIIVRVKQGRRIITRKGNYLGHSLTNLIIESLRSGCWYKIPLTQIRGIEMEVVE